MKYQCSYCKKLYDWYDGVYDDPEERDVFINANCFVLRKFDPVPEADGERLTVNTVGGNLDDTVINLCPECMRGLLSKCCPTAESINCFDKSL